MQTLGFPEQMRQSQLLRILLIGFLVLLLQIPTAMVQNLVSDRQNVRQGAITDITSKWGAAQNIIGPRLAIPYIKRVNVGKEIQARTHTAVFLPDDLKVESDLKTERRYRGIFEVPVYTSNNELTGRFEKPDFSQWGVKPEDILWDRAELSVQITDAKAIQTAKLQWNQAAIEFTPGTGKYGGDRAGIHALLKGNMAANGFNFSVPISVRGSERISFAPLGNSTQIHLVSDWKDPSFQGGWSPDTPKDQDKPTVTDKGFDATWTITALGRNYAQQWTSETPEDVGKIDASVVGVELISPVDNYRMADRSVKYNALFILLTFATFWFFELTTRLRVHPVQYLLVGLAMCVFYLLQLALSEHLGFHVAYAIASSAVVLLITAYSFGVLRAKGRGAVIGVMETVLYSYLYVVLASQDYSLLLGSLGLFLFLAIAMFFTRGLNATDSVPAPPSANLAPDLPPPNS